MYTEMEEHAKKLEIYADLFKVCQYEIDVNDEFMEAMIQINKFRDSRAESKKYVAQRERGNMVNVRSGIRGNSAGPPGGGMPNVLPPNSNSARANSANR